MRDAVAVGVFRLSGRVLRAVACCPGTNRLAGPLAMSRHRPPNLSRRRTARHLLEAPNCLGLLQRQPCALRCSPRAAHPTSTRHLNALRGPNQPVILHHLKGQAQHGCISRPMRGGTRGLAARLCARLIQRPRQLRSSCSTWCATDALRSISTSGGPLRALRRHPQLRLVRRLPHRAACYHGRRAQHSWCGRAAAAAAVPEALSGSRRPRCRRAAPPPAPALRPPPCGLRAGAWCLPGPMGRPTARRSPRRASRACPPRSSCCTPPPPPCELESRRPRTGQRGTTPLPRHEAAAAERMEACLARAAPPAAG